ncbi:PREDICTED: transcription factor DIVARICATA-like [Nelumbo nucifera]|uniref:Transcription factor DIVARICATA-like n=1 Tax=Nelumbo nucifera TaxID=4432 RepID=A0A1U8AKE5_NELNU|nr:PREDICTED: transcription factor DIVARICATA-like [Nelumbo nucifera]
MMRFGMEVLSPANYHFTNSNWFVQESKSSGWTHEENKMFENALAVFDKDTPDRWYKVASMIPGKTVEDVVKQYKELVADVGHIEAGRIPIPGYRTSPFTLEWVNNRGFDGLKQSFVSGGRRGGGASGRPSDQERKKGVPWTEEEHKLFLLGLKKYGKGDWRNISRNFVVTRTPTQVASHAQKYFIRQQLSGGKDKRRSSIHDITTVNLTDIRSPSPDNNRVPSPDHSAVLPQQPKPKVQFDWSQPNHGGHDIFFNQTNGNMFVSPPYGVTSYGQKMHGLNQQQEAFCGSQIRPQHIAFQMQ